MSSLQYCDTSFSEIIEKVGSNFIMVVTATKTETIYLHSNLTPIEGEAHICRVFKNNQTYFIGLLGLYYVIHVQTGMGSLSRDASTITLTEAINDLNPKAVAMIGIAFGIDKKKQSIGDVLVSEVILPYNFSRVGEKVIYRSANAYANKLLVNRFKNIFNWDYDLPNNKKAKIIIGHLLSGEELIDNIERRKELQNAFPNAKGGEMEGAGVFAACDNKTAWILVKGICDFADGNKKKNKDKNQEVAIKAAIAASRQLFDSPYSFDGLNIEPVIKNVFNRDESINKYIPDLNTLLFDVYKKEYEEFYIEREDDNQFIRNVNTYSVWLYGKSGAGKTNLALRNLIYSDKEVIQINLYGCINNNVDSFINEIINEVADLLNEQVLIKPNSSFSLCIKEFYRILKKYFSGKEVYIFLEEVPIGGENEYEEFTQKLIQLINAKLYYSDLSDVKFVLSSIDNPLKYIQSYQAKITQHLKFIEVTYWNSYDIQKLNILLKHYLSLVLDNVFEFNLLTKSKGCPRFIKAFYRNLTAINKFSLDDFDYALKVTLQDFYYL